MKEVKKKKAKCKIRAPLDRISCTLAWGLCFYIYIYILIINELYELFCVIKPEELQILKIYLRFIKPV